MATVFPPPTAKAWQYSSTRGGIEKNIRINPSTPIPSPKPDQFLVQTIASALNPIDYKPAEIPIVGRLIVPKEATPGLDFAGYVVKAAAGSSIKPGQLVFGVSGTSPVAGGALAEFAISSKEGTVILPVGVDPIHAATIGVAGLTAYQSIVPNVKKGDKVFINGGSGGTGVFGVQIAKAVGCFVTTSCSTANVAFCKSLGADEVIDYKKKSVVDALEAGGHKFDHVVDNVGADPLLYWRCHNFTRPNAIYIMVGGGLSLRALGERVKRNLWPGFLTGDKRTFRGFFPKAKYEDLEQIANWVKDGRIKPVIDRKFPFEEASEAFERLKTGRARGKIVIEAPCKAYGWGVLVAPVT